MSQTNNIYTTLAKSYSIAQLQNVVERTSEYPKSQVDACIAELNSRKVQPSTHRKLEDGKLQLHVLYVKNALVNQKTIEECKALLLQKELSPSQVEVILTIAQREPIPEIEPPHKYREYYGIHWLAGVIAIFLILYILNVFNTF